MRLDLIKKKMESDLRKNKEYADKRWEDFYLAAHVVKKVNKDQALALMANCNKADEELMKHGML